MRTARDWVILGAKGLAMGAADIVPGVSGGTIAFITGIYEEFIETLSNLNLGLIATLFKNGPKIFWKEINGNFLLALFTGILISIFSLARLIDYILEAHPHLLWAFFFGLVLASVFYVGKQVEKWTLNNVIGFILGGVVAFLITMFPPMGTADQLWFIFLCGAIAICAMILPGISGSFILLLLGAYQVVIAAIKNLDITLLLIFAAGCIIGLISFSKVLNYLFKKARNLTIAVLTGFLIGSLNKIWPWKENDMLLYTHSDGKEVWFQQNVTPDQFSSDPQILLVVGLMIIGIASILLLEKFGNSAKA